MVLAVGETVVSRDETTGEAGSQSEQGISWSAAGEEEGYGGPWGHDPDSPLCFEEIGKWLYLHLNSAVNQNLPITGAQILYKTCSQP